MRDVVGQLAQVGVLQGLVLGQERRDSFTQPRRRPPSGHTGILGGVESQGHRLLVLLLLAIAVRERVPERGRVGVAVT